MSNTDQGCPLIVYNSKDSYLDWGLSHGEDYRKGILELVEIRKELMLKRNPKLKDHLEDLAIAQFEATKAFAPDITQELEGIAKGADCSLTDIVILNNYTDFRDIILPDEGCSTVHVQNKGGTFSGQTWDMHGSAKNYVSVISIPKKDNSPAALAFSLVGCVGMMGINSDNLLIGVNNINTANAKAAVIWPVLVRKVLQQRSFESMRETLLNAPVTSGHNYILSSSSQGEHWEVTPTEQERVGIVEKDAEGFCFHTNHCLGEKIIPLEDKNSISSTTHIRYELLENKLSNINSAKDFYGLLTDHEGYPKSICSHFESGAQDPSFTCGGAYGELSGNDYVFWRGCPVYDSNYVEYKFKLENNEKFIKL